MQHGNSGVSREERRGENERGRALLAMSKLGRLCFAYTDSLSNENENMRLCLAKRLHTHTAKEVRIVSVSVCVRARARLLYSPVLVDAGAGQTDETPPAATVRHQ